MKGIILAGGSGTRLYPLTTVTSKQLLPIYDKPMIYYPLSTLMLAGIREILVISTPDDTPKFMDLLGDGSQFGIDIQYAFIGEDDVAMILGDNIFYGSGLGHMLREAATMKSPATIFSYYMENPTAFGVVEFDDKGRAVSIEEKPKHPKSNYAVTGMYFYDNKVVRIAKGLQKSARGEYEITDINAAYLAAGELDVKQLGRGYAWLDTGTVDALLDAANFIRTIESLQGIQISAPEEIAYNNRWITKAKLLKSAEAYGKSIYGRHLLQVAGQAAQVGTRIIERR